MKKIFSQTANEMMSPLNASVYENLVKLESATLECEQMELEVEGIEWGTGFQPRLVLKDNAKTKKFVKSGAAQVFGMKTKAGRRYDYYQMQVRGVKCIWKSEGEYLKPKLGVKYV